MARPSASAAASRSRSWGCTPCSADTTRCSAIGTCRRAGTPPRCAQAAGSEHYLLSANGIAETGEIINIDGAGNRVASAIYGHKKVWIIAGKNKLAPTYDEALWRARNIAAPKNAQRLHAKTPCAVKADHCYDCKSPGRICRALTVLWGAMMGSDMEVVLVNEDLGY